MRSLRLARIAAEAEGLRLRHAARRNVVRVVLGIVALGFLFVALALSQVAVWYWLRASFDRPPAALIQAGGNLLLAAILALFAARSSPGRVEAEALAIRRRAMENASRGLAFSAVATQLVPLAVRLFRKR